MWLQMSGPSNGARINKGKKGNPMYWMPKFFKDKCDNEYCLGENKLDCKWCRRCSKYDAEDNKVRMLFVL